MNDRRLKGGAMQHITTTCSTVTHLLVWFKLGPLWPLRFLQQLLLLVLHDSLARASQRDAVPPGFLPPER